MYKLLFLILLNCVCAEQDHHHRDIITNQATHRNQRPLHHALPNTCFDIDVSNNAIEGPNDVSSVMSFFITDNSNLNYNKSVLDSKFLYSNFYNRLFGPCRNHKLKVFLFGIDYSILRGWKHYFTNGLLYGAYTDIRVFFHKKNIIDTFQCDPMNATVVREMWNTDILTENFDIIIDGDTHSHSTNVEANVKLFENSFHKIKLGGVYIIENKMEQENWSNRFSNWKVLFPDFEFRYVVSINSSTTNDNIVFAKRVRTHSLSKLKDKLTMKAIKLSITEFNTIFSASLPAEGVNIPATVGVNNATVYYTGNELVDDFIANYWNYFHPYIKKLKYYFLVDYRSDGCYTYNEHIKNNVVYYWANSTLAHKIIRNDSVNYIPLMHSYKYRLCYASLINDKYAFAIPDGVFVGHHGHHSLLQQIDKHWVDWKHKENVAVYRGFINFGWEYNWMGKNYGYIDGRLYLPREYFAKLFERNEIQRMNYSSSSRLSVVDMLQFKYVLDIDGYASTYSGTFWKLYSGSVLLKQTSVWRQWYYDRLIPWVHYVPINNNFSDLSDKIEWCIKNDDLARKISENARAFVKKALNWGEVHKWLVHELNGFL